MKPLSVRIWTTHVPQDISLTRQQEGQGAKRFHQAHCCNFTVSQTWALIHQNLSSQQVLLGRCPKKSWMFMAAPRRPSWAANCEHNPEKRAEAGSRSCVTKKATFLQKGAEMGSSAAIRQNSTAFGIKSSKSNKGTTWAQGWPWNDYVTSLLVICVWSSWRWMYDGFLWRAFH